jgi:hypothetical protein
MANELTARFRFDRTPAPAELFSRVVASLSQQPEMIDKWSSFSIRSGSFSNVITEHASPKTEELITLANAHDGDDRRMSVVRPLRCWRFSGKQAELAAVPCIVEAFGSKYGREDARLRGDAAFSATQVGPFCALVHDAGADDPAVRAVNERVEQNLESFTKVIFRLIEVTAPASVHVYSDAGEALPFNAHLAYWADEAGPLADLQLIAEAWQQGLPAYDLSPLSRYDADLHKSALHSWRTAPQRQLLWQRLSPLVSKIPTVTREAVTRVLDSQRFTTYRVGSGFAVLDYPHFANAFVDRFLLDLLEPA